MGLMLPHRERHRYSRVGWLRAAVLGADDGIVSTASLIIGVAASQSSTNAIAIAGLAGLVAGAMSMAAGEFVSVSTQSDTEKAEIAKETDELRTVPERELEELTQIYIGRGLDRDLAQKVATRLQEVDPVGTHLREELGIIQTNTARPLQAALASSVSFSLGAAIPLLALLLAPESDRIAIIAITALVVLAVTGAVASRLGGSSPTRGALRVFIGGGLAMAVTALIGNLIGGAV